ncbi:tautomerase family protein [Bradyrhizobium sp. CB1650]|uniref:tautomerase family protein n=1 Tax=Bradyrhizobium sp. CB1650 TaxID=3039153 RepID=UPI0024358C1F|nr:tautomerase family protein [Bradyrhizobium sp. CB1650]WGD51084.1 tautomerase family protein [Bradyrhizobium sp. CB1650]
MFSGRLLEAKRALYKGLVTNLSGFGIPATEIKIIPLEVPAENWGLGGGYPASEIDLGFKLMSRLVNRTGLRMGLCNIHRFRKRVAFPNFFRTEFHDRHNGHLAPFDTRDARIAACNLLSRKTDPRMSNPFFVSEGNRCERRLDDQFSTAGRRVQCRGRCDRPAKIPKFERGGRGVLVSCL